jgi:hypothetical protein
MAVTTRSHAPEAPAANGAGHAPGTVPPDVARLQAAHTQRQEPPQPASLDAADQQAMQLLQELAQPPVHDQTLDRLVTSLAVERGKVVRAVGMLQQLQRMLADVRAERDAFAEQIARLRQEHTSGEAPADPGPASSAAAGAE